jgi:tRNA nucleotidyltransferase (CCA-adding enzyme)
VHGLTPTILRSIVTPSLLRLRAAFNHRSRDIRLVGGAVRDMLRGETPKDVDLATDATPEEQQAIYEKHGIRHIDTGLQHGTWTIVLDDGAKYEITTLRTETAHDGRHAEVAWTRDWTEDLRRRDLTINAMAMALDGTLFDPFNGERDLRTGEVRFVGDAAERIQEDYLRILRFYRFHGRFGGRYMNMDAMVAIHNHKEGLRGISRERVWSEVSRIISGPQGPRMFQRMLLAGLAPLIDLPDREGCPYALPTAFLDTQEPVSLMVAHLGSEAAVARLAALWKWSADERCRGIFLAHHLARKWPESFQCAQREVAVEGKPKALLAEYFRLKGRTDIADHLDEWQVPVFPITGDDLLRRGMKEGPKLGKALHDLRCLWVDQEFKISQADVDEVWRDLTGGP